MPVFDLALPDGRTLTLEAPNEQAALSAATDWHASNPKVDTATDVIKGTGSGLAQGAINLAGSIGDVKDMSLRAGEWLANKIGVPQSTIDAIRPYAQGASNLMLPGPTSQTIKDKITPITGEFYQPQTTLGQYAKTAGEFAPGALTGPGGIARRIATGVVAPAVGAETAGQVSDQNPFARVAGAVAGGLGASRIASGIARSQATGAVPSRQDLREAADQNYREARGLGVEIDPMATGILGRRVNQSLIDDGYRDYLAPKTFRALEELANPPGRTATIADIEGVRRALNTARKDPAESDAARRAINQIDDYLANLTPNQVVAGDATRAATVLSEARGNYAASQRSRDIQEATQRAGRNAASAGSGANIDNTTRQAIKAILNNPRRRAGFNDEEIAAMEQIVRGTFTGNVGRLLGKLAPTGVVSAGMSGGIGYGLGAPVGLGPITAFGVPAVGAIAKAVGDQSTRRGAAQLDALVRSRSPLANQQGVGAQNMQALLAAPPWLQQILLNSLMARAPFVQAPQSR